MIWEKLKIEAQPYPTAQQPTAMRVPRTTCRCTPGRQGPLLMGWEARRLKGYSCAPSPASLPVQEHPGLEAPCRC